MNTGEYIIVYTSVSLTVALCSPLSACPVTALLWCFCRPAIIRLFFPTPCLFVPFCVLRCDLFLDSISALTASVSLLIQIRRHLRRLSYASHCTFIQAHWLGLFFLRCWYGLLHAPVFAFCMPRTLPWWISAFDATNKAFHFDGILSQCSHSAWSLSFLLVRQSCLLRLWVECRDRCIKKKKKGRKERKKNVVLWQVPQTLPASLLS